MSVAASRTPVLLDLANKIVLRQEGLGAEVHSGLEPKLEKLPSWFFDGNGVTTAALLRINCTELDGSCTLALKSWSSPDMSDSVYVWEQPETLRLGYSTYLLNTKDMFGIGPAGDGEKFIGIAHDLSEGALVAYSAEIVKALPAR